MPPIYNENPVHLDGVGDMSLLIHLDAPNVLHNLVCRYNNREIYTSISKILLAVNPYSDLGIYGENVIMMYKKNAQEALRARIISNPLPPHVFSISQASHMNLLRTNINQSMIVCGESGSGKTESAKYLLRYLAYRCSSSNQEEMKGAESDIQNQQQQQLETQVLAANPILESFGNAKTLLNDNSSRFGKFTKVVYAEGNQAIVGSFIETYLLEKSRVVKQDKGERNYHIFYMLAQHTSLEQAMKEKLFLSTTAATTANTSPFHYLSQSGCMHAEGWKDEIRFAELCQSFSALGVDETKQTRVFAIVSAVLHLGNIGFTADADAATIDNQSIEQVRIVCELLQIAAENLTRRLTTSTIYMKDQAISKKFSQAQAIANRDSMAKALYNSLFDWLVVTINSTLYSPLSRKAGLNWIGILDVFGFECFETNSFEQFCINFANERLQQFFNIQLLESEQQEYLSQSISWDSIYIASNQDVIDLIDGRPQGILAILNSACKLPKADDETFTRDLFQLQKDHKRLKQVKQLPNKQAGQRLVKINAFSILHYAGEVIYNAKDFLTKNNDNASVETIALFESSECALIKTLMRVSVNEKTGASGASSSTSSSGSNNSNKSFTVGSTFSRQLSELVEHLDHTIPYFIRCIKPNTLKQPFTFDADYVLPQLKCGGIIEALRILKLGFPTRCSYEQIFERYASICRLPRPETVNKRDFTEAVMAVCGGEGGGKGKPLSRNEYQLGLTKIFFRPGKQQFLESLLSTGDVLPKEVIERIRKYLLFKHFRRAVATIQANRVFALRLREMRAAKQMRMLLSVVDIVNKTFLKRLRGIRMRKMNEHVQTLQACVRSTLASSSAQQQKESVCKITQFYKNVLIRRRLSANVSEKIQTKQRSAIDEKESREKDALEAKLRKEKARSDIITSVRFARTKRVEQQQQREAEKSNNTGSDGSNSSNVSSGRISIASEDPVVSLLTMGHSFVLENVTIYLCCNAKENTLQWTNEDESVVGFVPLRRIDRVHLHKSQEGSPSLVLLKTGNEQLMQLLPVAEEPAAYLFWWLVGLRYLLTNLKDVGSMCREVHDPLRANQLAWQLMLQNEELSRKLVNLEQKCKVLMQRAGGTLSGTLRRKRDDVPGGGGQDNNNVERKDPPPYKRSSPSNSQVRSGGSPSRETAASSSSSIPPSTPAGNSSSSSAVVRSSPRSPPTLPAQCNVVIWFPDGSRTTLLVSTKSSTAEVIAQMAQTIHLIDYEGYTLVDVDMCTRAEKALKLTDRFPAHMVEGQRKDPTQYHRFVFKRRVDTGMKADPVATTILYWQTVHELCEHKLGVGEEDLIELMALHRIILSTSPYTPITSQFNEIEMKRLKKLNPWTHRIESLENFPGQQTPLSPDKKAIKKQIVKLKKEEKEFKTKVKKVQKIKEKEMKQKERKEAPKETMTNFLFRMQKYPLFGCQFFLVKQDEKPQYPHEMIIGINLRGVYFLDKDTRVEVKVYDYDAVLGCGTNSVMFSLVVQGQEDSDGESRINMYTNEGADMKTAIRSNIRHVARMRKLKRTERTQSVVEPQTPVSMKLPSA